MRQGTKFRTVSPFAFPFGVIGGLFIENFGACGLLIKRVKLCRFSVSTNYLIARDLRKRRFQNPAKR